jgi:hypothetical protein
MGVAALVLVALVLAALPGTAEAEEVKRSHHIHGLEVPA